NDIQSNYIDDLKELNINLDKGSATQFLFNPNLLNLISENYDDETQELVKYITEKHIQILNNRLLNNHQYRLRELDKEIISQVPIDGNWTDLSQETINKSKRLTNIAKNGGRTTLYGRLNYKKPANTISTYFNRPGNGRNIHPIKDRVLTTRE